MKVGTLFVREEYQKIQTGIAKRYVSAVERVPTLSAGYKNPPRQLRLHLLPDLIVLW
jgi:hypothetical protein